MQAREEKFKAEAAAKAAAEEAARVFKIVLATGIHHLMKPPPQIAKMSPEELERLRNRCKKFGLPFPGGC